MGSRSLIPKGRVGWLICWGFLGLIFMLRFPVKFSLQPPYLMDFEVYRAAAQRIAQGGAEELYGPTYSKLAVFKYAPCWVLLWLPLAWIPSHIGPVLWASLTVLWLLIACGCAVRLCHLAGLRAPPWLPVVTVALLTRPLTAEFLNGQVDLLWALLTMGFLVADLSAQRTLAALLLAFAIGLKLPAIIFLGYLLARRRWDMVARVGCAFLAVNVFSSILLTPSRPFASLIAWPQVLWSSGASRAFEIGNQSLLTLAKRFLSDDPYELNLVTLPLPVVMGLTVLLAAVLFGLVLNGRSSRQPEPRRLAFDGSLLTLLMVLCSPTVWIATYSALLLPVSVAVACASTNPRQTWHRGVSAVLACAVLALSVMTHSWFWKALGIRSWRGESYVFLVLMILPWFALALFGYLWIQRRHPLPPAAVS